MMKDLAQIKKLEGLHIRGALLILVRLLTEFFLEIMEISLWSLFFHSSPSFPGGQNLVTIS